MCRADEANYYGSIAVSDGATGYYNIHDQLLATTSRKKSTTSRSPPTTTMGRRITAIVNDSNGNDDAGLIFLGQHVHSMQEHFNKKAE